MLFDIILGNPPFNSPKNNKTYPGGCGTLWDRFVKHGFTYLKPNGLMLFITPCGWRLPATSKYRDARQIMLSKQILWLKINTQKQSLLHFPTVTSTTDYYLIKNADHTPKQKTEIIGIDRVPSYFYLHPDLPFVPHGKFAEIYSLVDVNNNMYSFIDQNRMRIESRTCSLTKTETQQNPVIYYLTMTGPKLIYTSIPTPTTPKVIWCKGNGFMLLDQYCQYHISQVCHSITSLDIQYLKNIKQCFESQSFKNLSKFFLFSNGNFSEVYDSRILKYFKPDFYKLFI